MGKMTRFKYGVANERGTALTKAGTYTITEQDILNDGVSFFKINGAYTLTLPVVNSKLKGISLLIFGNDAASKVYVSGGFGGGGNNYDTVTIGVDNAVEFWCDGTYWYA